MELKPKSIKLVDLKEESLPTGRKLLSCIFEDKYGGASTHYSWTPPWRSKDRNIGIEQLFFKCLAVEEWNDPEGVWTDELKEASKEVPSLEEMKLPVKVSIGEITEDSGQREEGARIQCWMIEVHLSSNEQYVGTCKKGDKDYVTVGNVNMDWTYLQSELFGIQGIKFISKHISSKTVSTDWFEPQEMVASFEVWVEKTADRTQYQVVSREIVYRIRRFVQSRLSEYKSLKKGFDEPS